MGFDTVPYFDFNNVVKWVGTMEGLGREGQKQFLRYALVMVRKCVMKNEGLADLVPSVPEEDAKLTSAQLLTAAQRKMVFFLGVGGLIFVPIFKSLTHLPPFVGILLVLSFLIVVVASLTAPAPDAAHQDGLCFSCLSSAYRRENRESWNWIDVVASLVVVGCVVAAYVYFWNWLG